MFGHQDEPAQQNNGFGDQPAVTAPTDNSFIVGAPNAALPPADSGFGGPTAPSAPVTDTNSLLEPEASDGLPPTSDQAVVPDSNSDDSSQNQPVAVGTPSPLSELKQQALQQLSPLVSHLDQTPEEKFRTTMMMIQASDNQDLLQTAYDAANQITDEKAKAQALLDVINEINYFSQKAA